MGYGGDWNNDDKYCYPGSNVLKNKFDIRNADLLAEKERTISGLKLSYLSSNPIRGNLDLKHLQKIHSSIFGEIYEWAGKARTIDISKGNIFCKSQYIHEIAQETFDTLRKDHYLLGCQETKVCSKLAYYMGEINALHPFREGNGRAQRVFIENLAAVAGYKLDFNKIDSDKLLEATIETFHLKYDRLGKLLQANISRNSYEEQMNFCKRISFKTGPLAESVNHYFDYIKSIASDIEQTGFNPTNSAIQRMEQLNQTAQQKLTVKNAHRMLHEYQKKILDRPNLQNALDGVKQEFAGQEKSNNYFSHMDSKNSIETQINGNDMER